MPDLLEQNMKVSAKVPDDWLIGRVKSDRQVERRRSTVESRMLGMNVLIFMAKQPTLSFMVRRVGCAFCDETRHFGKVQDGEKYGTGYQAAIGGWSTTDLRSDCAYGS